MAIRRERAAEPNSGYVVQQHGCGSMPRWVTSLVLVLMLVGCVSGPDFRVPAAPDTQSYTSETQTVGTQAAGGAAQRFDWGGNVPDDWWTLFRSPELDRVVRLALEQNPTLAAAQATLREAQEMFRARSGQLYFPNLDATVGVTRERPSIAAFGIPGASSQPFTLYNASVEVSYTLDLFGGLRREVEGLRAQVDYQSYQREATYLVLTGNIVTAAVREAALRAQIEATEQILEAAEKELEIVERQFGVGAVARTDLLAQRTATAQIRARLPALERQLDAIRHQLAVYLGRLPERADMPTFMLNDLALPTDLPVSLPSSLVRQRPDIRSAEALLHVAAANVGVATANLYPQIRLSGSYGTQATTSGDFFGAGNRFWSLGVSLLQPIFHADELSARRRAAVAGFEAAQSQYRAIVLGAFQNVADVLRALDTDARALLEQESAASAAGETLALVRMQYRIGAASYLQLLDAQRQFEQERINLVQAQATRYTDTAALFQALGGGWWNRVSHLPPMATRTSQ